MEFLSSMRPSIYSLLFCLLLAIAPAFARAATEAELRAAVIFNIARFVQWPRTAIKNADFDICTVGDNLIADALMALAGKPLNGLSVTVRPVRRDGDLSGCRVLYIAPDDVVRMAAISTILTDNHEATLTISDAPSFLALGGMVQLIVVEDRQRFRINQELAEKFHLNINAKLLQLALPEN